MTHMLVLDYKAVGQDYAPHVLHLFADCPRFTYQGYPTAPAQTRPATPTERTLLPVCGTCESRK